MPNNLIMNHRYCFIISCMRSGSTLLKALIATRPDCTDLPETSFRDFTSVQSYKKIIVLKKPAGYGNLEYPTFEPVPNLKKIVLIRHPYDVVCSLRNMNIVRNQAEYAFNSLEYLISYWYMVYSNVVEKGILESDDTLLVRYEDLVRNPIEQSARVFDFIGTACPEGTDTYSAPANYNWEWRMDDGGEVIKTLKVQCPQREEVDEGLMDFIDNSEEIQALLSCYGYETTYPVTK